MSPARCHLHVAFWSSQGSVPGLPHPPGEEFLSLNPILWPLPFVNLWIQARACVSLCHSYLKKPQALLFPQNVTGREDGSSCGNLLPSGVIPSLLAPDSSKETFKGPFSAPLSRTLPPQGSLSSALSAFALNPAGMGFFSHFEEAINIFNLIFE